MSRSARSVVAAGSLVLGVLLTACGSGAAGTSTGEASVSGSSALPPAPSTRLELPSTTISAGGGLNGTLVIVNDTGAAVEATGCTSPFDVVLGNDTVPPMTASRACLQTFTIPEGQSTWPVTVRATYPICTAEESSSAVSLPVCQANGEPAPLPVGTYEATVVGSTTIPLPDPVPVTVI